MALVVLAQCGGGRRWVSVSLIESLSLFHTVESGLGREAQLRIKLTVAVRAKAHNGS